MRDVDLHRTLFVSVFALLFFSYSSVDAQLKRVPLRVKPQSKTQIIHQSASARTAGDSPLSLPFFDDFSKLPSDENGIPFPNADASLWVNSNSVWINNGMAINPPSVNVATFDGLDSVYLPYEESQILLNGITDKLVSKPIDLSVLTPDKRNTVYLSFYYQWAGNGEPPDPTDYLQIEFLNKDSVWETAERIQPVDTFKISKFYYITEKVDTFEQRFFHEKFQFRISRYGRESGPFDTWNVDYIYLNSDRSAGDKSFPDIAMSTPATALFKPYQAVPVKHFFAAKHVDGVTFAASNLQDALAAGNYRAWGRYVDSYKDKPTVVNDELLVLKGAIGTGVMQPDSVMKGQLLNLPDVNNTNYFDSTASEIKIKLKFKIFKEDSTSFPVSLKSNDTLSTFYTMKDYYAYDDGIAEYSVVLTQPGNAAAVLFDMITPRKDTLIGFDIYFPGYGVASNQTVNLSVYRDNNGIPGTIIASSNSYLVQRKEVNEFSRIIISPVVVQGKFYIGWTEPGSGLVKVGLDFSNDASDKIFVKVGSTWSQNAGDIQGSLMIRPVFGSADVIAGLPEENNFVTWYPNPTNGTFFIRGKYDHLEIISSTGQPVSWLLEDSGDDKRITMQSAPGLYLVQIRKGNKQKTGKLIIK